MNAGLASRSAFYRWFHYWILSFPLGIPVWHLKGKHLFQPFPVDKTTRGTIRRIIHMIIFFALLTSFITAL